MRFDDLTLVTCSYDTPHITMTMLRSWASVNGDVSNNLMLIDNSVEEDTAELLHKNNIFFIRNPSSKHYEGVEIALKLVTTKYALLVDTDIIFNKNLGDIFQMFKDNNYTIMGEVCGSRGGVELYDRIHPWFCFIDVENVNKNNIKFANIEKIYRTSSEGAFGITGIDNIDGFHRNVPSKFYDVGATFYEDILEKGLTSFNIKLDPEYYFHYEGMSWRGKSGIPGLVQANIRNEMTYVNEHRKYSGVNIKDWFINF